MAGAVFLWGGLCDRAVLAAVLGEAAAAARLGPARLAGHALRIRPGADHPLLCPAPGEVAEGLLAEGLGAPALARLGFLAGVMDWRETPVTVETGSGPAAALTWTCPAAGDAAPWDAAAWAAGRRAAFRELAEELMDHFGTDPARARMLLPGMRLRAEARAAAASETPRASLRRGFTRADVAAIARARPWAGHFAIESHRISHRRFAGGMTPPLLREVFASGDAVTVLPWDPVADRVLIVEQWRAGPWARGDRMPWCLEAIAGRRDPGEGEEDAARREAAEEAGLALGRLALIGRYYPTPGAVAERLTSYVGEADLSSAGGVHGLAGEHEDIRSLILPTDAALDAIAGGEVNSGPLIVSLLWLARERDRLARAWAA